MSAEDQRDTLKRAIVVAGETASYFDGYCVLQRAIFEVTGDVDQPVGLGRPEGDKASHDHEAMEVLRRASLKKGWRWRWNGMDLVQEMVFPGTEGVYKDPAEALRHPTRKPTEREE